MSASITTTKKCCIVVTATLVNDAGAQVTQIKRAGVDKTKETVISGADSGGWRMHLQYTTEVLDAGTYQYDLVNNAGGNLQVIGATIKAVAVED